MATSTTSKARTNTISTVAFTADTSISGSDTAATTITGGAPYGSVTTTLTGSTTSYGALSSSLNNFGAFSASFIPGTYTIGSVGHVAGTINVSVANSSINVSNGVVYLTNGAALPEISDPSDLVVASYNQLTNSLIELHGLEDGDDWKINTPVYAASIQVAAVLMEYDIPRPAVFTHGPNSVVFNWSQDQNNLYLTISKSRLSVLVSSNEGIEMRTDISDTADTDRFFSALRSVPLLGPPEK